MTDNRTPEVDPRYDPAFQRHGSGAQAPAARTRWADPVPVRAERAERHEEFIGAPPDGIEQLGLAVDGDDRQDADDEIRGTGTAGRWELAILVTGIALVVGGVSLITSAVHMNFNGYSSTGNGVPIEYIIGQLGYFVASPLIMVGLAAIVGLLFLRAVRARGRR